MLVFDKYGEEGVNKYYEIIYCSVYRLRLERYQVKYEMVLKYATDNNLFGIIENSQNYQNLRVFSEIMMKDIECRRVSEVDIVHLMKDKKVTLSSKDNNITIALNKLEKND